MVMYRRREATDPFLRRLESSDRKWAVLVNAAGEPLAVLDVHSAV